MRFVDKKTLKVIKFRILVNKELCYLDFLKSRDVFLEEDICQSLKFLMDESKGTLSKLRKRSPKLFDELKNAYDLGMREDEDSYELLWIREYGNF